MQQTATIPPSAGVTDMDLVVRTIAEGEDVIRRVHAVRAPDEDLVFAKDAYLDYLNDAAETIRARGESEDFKNYFMEMAKTLLPLVIWSLDALEEAGTEETVKMAQGVDSMIGVVLGARRVDLISEDDALAILGQFNSAVRDLRRTIARKRKDNPSAFQPALDALDEYSWQRGFELAHTNHYGWADLLVMAGRLKVSK